MVLASAPLLAPSGAVIQDLEVGSSLRFVAQTIVMFVSFGVFFIQWLPPKQLKSVQSIFIAAGFLSTGILTFAHIMTCSMLLNITETDEAPLGSFFHMMSGVTMAGTLLIAAYIPHQRRIAKGESNLLLLGFLAYTAVIVTTASLLSSSIPPLCPHDAQADATRIVVESVVILTLLAATMKYHSSGHATKNRIYGYLACGTLLGAYNHVSFTLHEVPYDVFSILSMLFTIASFSLVFVALFSISVVQPYERLRKAQRQAERRRKEVETATVKAQTYLDFLSHDIANMISPIMNRAEIIQQSQDASEKDKEEAAKIIEQTQKVASLIVNLRRLSRAERVDLSGLGTVDLRVLLPDLVKSRRLSYPEKKLKFTVQVPSAVDVTVMGGSVVEEIIQEVLDNAIKHSDKETVRITVNVLPEKDRTGRDLWNIEVADDGPGIPDHVKSALNVGSSSPEKRFSRGVASSLTIMALIAEQLGGRIKVEDSVPGDHTKGTRVTVTLPMPP